MADGLDPIGGAEQAATETIEKTDASKDDLIMGAGSVEPDDEGSSDPVEAPVDKEPVQEVGSPTEAPVVKEPVQEASSPTEEPVGREPVQEASSPTEAPVVKEPVQEVSSPTEAPVGREPVQEVVSPTEAPVGREPVQEVSSPTEAPVSKPPTDELYGEESISGEIKGESVVVEPEKNKVAIAVQVPKNLDFVMDPWNLCKKGYIWSEEYAFRNNGLTAVSLELENVRCVLQSGIGVAGAEESESAILDSEERVIRLQLILGNGDVLNVTDEGSSYEVVLAPGEALTLSVGGCLSQKNTVFWQSGDVSLEMLYNIKIAK